MIATANLPAPYGSEFLFSNTREFIPYTVELTDGGSALGYGNFTLITTGAISSGHMITVSAMIVVYSSALSNTSDVTAIQVYPSSSFLYGLNSPNHETVNTGWVYLTPHKAQQQGTLVFTGSNDLQWSQGGNFNAVIVVNMQDKKFIYAQMAYDLIQIAPQSDNANITVDAYLIALELYVLAAILFEISISEHHDHSR